MHPNPSPSQLFLHPNSLSSPHPHNHLLLLPLLSLPPPLLPAPSKHLPTPNLLSLTQIKHRNPLQRRRNNHHLAPRKRLIRPPIRPNLPLSLRSLR